MSNAIERLAAELMKLSNDEWSRVTERWRAGLDWDAVFGPAWDEISERLCEVDRSVVTLTRDGDALVDVIPQATVRLRQQA